MSDLIVFLSARLDEDKVAAYTAGAVGTLDEAHVARLMREVEAKRAIVDRYEDCLARQEDPDYPAGVARDQAREYEDFVLPGLAAIYSDHPDYRQEWKP